MKLSFSTLGCPGWSWSDIFTTAKDIGMDGIEIRGLGNELYAPACKPFTDDKIVATKKKLEESGMVIPVFTSGAVIGVKEKSEAAIKEAKGYIDLASKMGTKYVRVMVTSNPYPENTDLEVCKKNYGEICDYAADKNVIPLLETNGALANSKVMAQLIKEVNRPNSGVLWDVHHPYRYFGESAKETAENLEGMIKHVHVKDSVFEDGKVIYRMMGYGDVPVFDAVKELNGRDYDGFISLEWVKRWNPDLQEPGIVFAHFANYMKYLARVK